MGYRSGFTLRQLLKESRPLTKCQDTLEYIDAAIEFMQPEGSGGGYQRGARLVQFLRRASLTALSHEEATLAERLADFADYAEGKIPLTVLEVYYVPKQRTAADNMVQLTIKEGARRVAEGLDEFLAERSGADTADIQDWIRGLIKATDHLSIGSGRGGISLPRSGHDHLIFLSRVELLFEEVGDSSLDEILAWPHAKAIAHLIEVKSRQEALDKLRRSISDPDSTEHDIHRCLAGNYWMFGGTYMRELDTRRLRSDAVVDIPLLRGDGALHIVELKKANVAGLLTRYGSQTMLGGAIHRAVSQMQNYLQILDEDRDRILRDHGIDSRRAFGTVVIGSVDFVKAGPAGEALEEKLRTYNSHLSRIEVITYDTLIASAERALDLASERT
ncbi:Shedu anti-phage system protein SduA domain-containing protein [Cryptosporangium sp. NPDC048952]|uniref:Shedu anti-phage system protein SduA domain-containing protein n=1 Tax=Cryptosporangium sp. NPDC048952 TaxID=3363961 RepID=UPI00371317AC